MYLRSILFFSSYILQNIRAAHLSYSKLTTKQKSKGRNIEKLKR